jgi:hypothetical protein
MGNEMRAFRQAVRQLDWCEKVLALAQQEKELRQKSQAKARSKRRPKCQCAAYPWPHRPSGGLCRWPDPPLETWKGKAGGNRPQGFRHRGLVKRICQQYGLNPIKDRERIERLMPWLYPAWCKRYLRLRLGYMRWHDLVDDNDRLQIGAKLNTCKIPKYRLGLKQWQGKGLKSYEEHQREWIEYIHTH